MRLNIGVLRRQQLKLGVFICLVFFQFGCATQPKLAYQGWTHLELGAGNYGEDGHTQTSLKKTVLKALHFVSDKPNFIDKLPKEESKEYKPEEQYQVLFWTLDQLVKRLGDTGVFHVNDLVKEYADFASARLRDYAKARGYHRILVEAVPGDYSKLDPKETLSEYNRTKYDSVHLKNPEVSFYHHGLDGDQMVTNDQTRARARELLQRLANLSSRGLYFFPIEHKHYFIPVAEEMEFIDRGIFYMSVKDWEPVPYVFPTGESISKQFGRVYFIHAVP